MQILIRATFYIVLFFFSFYAFSKDRLINPYASRLTNIIPFSDFESKKNEAFACQAYEFFSIPEDLDIESKYIQSEKTKSTLKKNLETDTVAKKQQIVDFLNQVSTWSDQAVYADNQVERLVALNCLFDTLHSWAEKDALIHVLTSDSGSGSRKWLLSSIASNLLKTEAVYMPFSIPEDVKQWIKKLTLEVQKDYAYRLFAKPKAINNHDYWAAWAVACSAVLLRNPHYLNYSEKVFDVALNQISRDKTADYAYLPNEVARADLAVEYTHFALVPLLFLADLLTINGSDVNVDREKLKLLARFAFDSVESSASVGHIISKDQQAIQPKRWLWVFPYVSLVNDSSDVLTQSIQANQEWLTIYPLVGGDISAFYSIDVASKGIKTDLKL